MDQTELLESIDIIEYLSQFIELEEKNGEWWALSPFKDEKTPSFSVRKETGRFYDFSSGFGGSLISFNMHYFNCSAEEAIEKLRSYAGLDGEELVPRKKMEATSICKRFQKPKTTQKTSSPTILPDDYMLRYEKRKDKLEVWSKEGVSDESLDRFQVYYDSFSDRLVYPIRNIDGKIVNIGGRTLDPLWKEKKQRKYCYFYSWGTINTIYGIAENIDYILQKKEIIIFEGCKSVLIADGWGIKNTGAILTSHLSRNQLKILAKLGCRVVFALDNDVRIRDDRNIEVLRNYVPVEYILDRSNLLDEKDSPVDKGEDVFETLYEQRRKYR